TTVISNVEYRIPIVGPVTLAAFADFGLNLIARNSQLRVNPAQLADLNNTPFGCPALDGSFNCTGGVPLTFEPDLKVVSNTNFVPRMSTGLEVQVLMPVVNAPFRIYYAFNPLRMNTSTIAPVEFTREMFPVGGAGDFSYQQAVHAFGPTYRLRDPRTTFRFTVSTTF
ncbi:MAG: outer membrane protein assembly factor BamA, partial [Terriglobales bacterium]